MCQKTDKSSRTSAYRSHINHKYTKCAYSQYKKEQEEENIDCIYSREDQNLESVSYPTPKNKKGPAIQHV